MNTDSSELYRNARYRMLENSHILLWLIKDTFWALEFKAGGMFMIVPTIAMAIYITYRSVNTRTELLHNIAVCFWILANSTWMVGEFFGHDMRGYAVVMFAMGLAVLAFYYLFYFRKETTPNPRPNDSSGQA